MKKVMLKSSGIFLAAVLFAGMAVAQEEVTKEKKKVVKEEVKSTVTIKVSKDGETVLDSTFTVDKDMDKDQIHKLIKKIDGDNVYVKYFDSAHNKSANFVHAGEKMAKSMFHIYSEDGEEIEFDMDMDVHKDVVWSVKEGEKGHKKYKVITHDIHGCEGHDETEECCDEKHVEKEHHAIVIKKGKEGETETFDILIDKKGGHKLLETKEGNVLIKEGEVFFKGEKGEKGDVKMIKKKDDLKWIYESKGDLFFDSAKGDVKVIKKKDDLAFWVDESEGDVVVDVIKKGEGDNEFFFATAAKTKGQIQLQAKADGMYRLEFNSDELDPIAVAVFDGEGKRLYKKKVRNFYGRFLTEIPLEYNESGFYTVTITQGDKEIIGEFEFK